MYYYCAYCDIVNHREEPVLPLLNRIMPISAQTESRLLSAMYAHFLNHQPAGVLLYSVTLTENHCNKRKYRISHKGHIRYDGYNIFTGEHFFQREHKPWG